MSRSAGPVKILAGKASFHVYWQTGVPTFEIQIEDASSHVQAVTIKLSSAQFAEFMAHKSYVDCTYEINAGGPIGYGYQIKTEAIPEPEELGGGYVPRDKLGPIIDKMLAPYEVDGWHGSRSDATNSHRSTRTKSGARLQQVSFHRWVDKDGNPWLG